MKILRSFNISAQIGQILKSNMLIDKILSKTKHMFIRQDLHKVNLLHLLAVVEKKLKLKDFVWILQIF